MLATGPRVEAENLVIGLADRGVRSSAVRLPPVVHSSLDKRGFIPAWIGAARAVGRSGWIAPFVTMDNPTSSARTRRLPGREPAHPGLDQGHYFTTE